MSGRWLTPFDSMFLHMETPDSMMHVGGLFQFDVTTGTAADMSVRIRDELLELTSAEPPWNMKLLTPGFLRNPAQRWVTDKKFDPMNHIHRSALPSPGGERELGVLVSRLHSRPIDFRKPPWECYIIEGLEGGKLAMYAKVHHSLIDGYTAVKMLIRSLSTDPNDTDHPLFFQVPQPKRRPRSSNEVEADQGSFVQAAAGHLTSARDMRKAFTRLTRTFFNKEDPLITLLQAPKSILNGRIGRNRRFSTQQYEIPRLRKIAAASGGTLNDVVLAVCGGGLRSYLLNLNALPKKPLIAFVPVNIRPKDDPGGGNLVGGMLASLGTHIEDPVRRMEAIIASTGAAKAQMENMTRAAIVAYTAYVGSPLVGQTGLAQVGLSKIVPPSFNVVISNVPGPTKPMYFRGCRMTDAYPVSFLMHGGPLNITCESYVDTLNFGFVGCRDTLPHMQRLALACGDALAELEKYYGVGSDYQR
ncbi:wax ester/triacylglycerol synthase family O-acyltransferase [Hoyosella rhizosphaerae]|uniref:Diacylglycerol O-acyltransferase n=1 Tax=Hoyosella rhizosphaerae TaxID=1755582 RepID=A0A916U1S3_9ACTN|nr:wax ester/triacylglycerol synthase family O-acyltransferase [Hoyosella rhizosphaerae]MBN4926835.1 wax ester/triacylglycerol synthase family O-acyltransferase [Hoyosella rhizosphaerae]GGC56139.1 putative diacyglycerol O-acyltransferase [Hoyosella rhizosphaerae]